MNDDYRIIVSEDTSKLCKLVNKALADGKYAVAGGVAFAGKMYAQALIRKGK